MVQDLVAKQLTAVQLGTKIDASLAGVTSAQIIYLERVEGRRIR